MVQIDLAFADDKIKVTEKLKFALGWVEIIVWKWKNTGYQQLAFFHNVFIRLLIKGL